jgi:hypothetical protein
VGDSFEDKDRTLFVARYIERCSLSLEKLSIDEDIVTYTTNDGRAHEFDALEFLALLFTGIPKPGESVTVIVKIVVTQNENVMPLLS